MNTTTLGGYAARTTYREASRVRVGALAGIVGPLLFTLGFLVQEAFRREEFSPLAEPVSALEAGPNGWIQQVNFGVFGLMMLTFAVGLNRGVAATRSGTLGPALLGVAGVGLVLAAAFPLREDAAGVTYDPGFHFVAGVTFFLSTSLALLTLSRRLSKDSHWRGLATYAAACGVLALIGFVVLGRFAIPDGAPLHDYAGLAQRMIILLVTFPCLVALGARLRTSPATHGSSAG
jgi:hypothetical membrane protein